MKLVEYTEKEAHETCSRWILMAAWRKSVVVLALKTIVRMSRSNVTGEKHGHCWVGNLVLSSRDESHAVFLILTFFEVVRWDLGLGESSRG